MDLPDVTEPSGLYEWLIVGILLLALLFGLLWVAVSAGVLDRIFQTIVY